MDTENTVLRARRRGGLGLGRVGQRRKKGGTFVIMSTIKIKF